MPQTREERVVVWQRFVLLPDAPEALLIEALQRALARAEATGASVLATLGGTVVLGFSNVELEDAVELARTEADELLDRPDGLRIHVAIALGEIEEQHEPKRGQNLYGPALDRAQALANRARAGEIVLDEPAAQRAEERYLFARELSAGICRGQVLDPSHADKRLCRSAIGYLRPPPLASSAEPTLAALVELARQPSQQRIAIYTDVASAGLELAEHAARKLTPSMYLRMSRKAGGYQPLGSLCVALRGLWPEDDDLHAAALPPLLQGMFQALLAGASVQRSHVVEGLAQLCRLYTDGASRPLFVLDQLHEIDPATLGVVAEAVMMPDLDIVLLMIVPSDVGVPTQLVPESELSRLELPRMSGLDAERVAAAVLGLESGTDISQRVAALGGESSLGIREAARTLVSAGDLVLRQEHFGWRVAPRSAARVLPLEALLTERIAGLGASAYRVLEALCVSPPDVTFAALAHTLERDGLVREELETGLVQLRAEGFVEGQVGLGLADAAIRGAMRNNMPTARAAELHRFVAAVFASSRQLPGFGSGELAYHLAEGGLESEAAVALIDAAKAAADTGFQRVALRLLATAVKLDNSIDIRRAAHELARTVDSLIHPQPAHPRSEQDEEGEYEELKSEDLNPQGNLAQSAMRAAVKALANEDFDSVERFLDAAVAAGFGKTAAQRVLALTQLARGEMAHATQTLQGSSHADAPPPVRARDTLSWSLLHTLTGDITLGIRDALEALALSRRGGDAEGQLAALHVLSLCYRVIEREDDASRIAQAADRLQHAEPELGASPG